jgi:hypothetical protein
MRFTVEGRVMNEMILGDPLADLPLAEPFRELVELAMESVNSAGNFRLRDRPLNSK